MTDGERRAHLLMDLSDAINELTEPRSHTQYIEESVAETKPGRNGKNRTRTVRRRRAHITTRPGLLIELQQAAVPGSSATNGSTSNSFESRPAAELDPISVLREITDDTGYWIRKWGIERPTLSKTLHGLVSAPHTDAELTELAAQARRWVRRARLATGFDPAPFVLNQPCVYCGKKHSIVITSDMQNAKCSKCGVLWTPDTVGLLSEMIRANETQEVLALAPCWMSDCTRVGQHDQHQDSRGRCWPREARCIGEDGHPVTWTA